MKVCPYCESEIANNSKKCKYCGEVVIEEKKEKYCPYCEAKLSDTAKKCKHCGEWVDSAPERQYLSDEQECKNSKNVINSAKGKGSYNRSPLDSTNIECLACGYKGTGGRIQGSYGAWKIFGLFSRSIKDWIIGRPVCCPNCNSRDIIEIEVYKASFFSKIWHAFMQFFLGLLFIIILIIIIAAVDN